MVPHHKTARKAVTTSKLNTMNKSQTTTKGREARLRYCLHSDLSHIQKGIELKAKERQLVLPTKKRQGEIRKKQEKITHGRSRKC